MGVFCVHTTNRYSIPVHMQSGSVLTGAAVTGLLVNTSDLTEHEAAGWNE
jgi:hypothetical protein